MEAHDELIRPIRTSAALRLEPERELGMENRARGREQAKSNAISLARLNRACSKREAVSMVKALHILSTTTSQTHRLYITSLNGSTMV